MMCKSKNFEIGRILHFKSEIRNLELDYRVQIAVSGFGFEMQDSSNFEISRSPIAEASVRGSAAARRSH